MKQLKAIEKTQGELETLKQAKAIEARKELLVELNAKLEEYEPFKDKVYLSIAYCFINFMDI